MQIISCHIDNFGKMHNLNCSLKSGMNVLNAPNGWGKTTFAVFVRAMFYGMADSSDDVTFQADDIRKKYRPWDGGVFGGSITFDVGGTGYILSRTFGDTKIQDTFSLTDMSGEKSSDYSVNIGEELFGIDDATYARSTYIPQQAVTVAMSGSIDSNLHNLVEGENNLNSYDDAMRRLAEAKMRISRNGERNMGREDDPGKKRIAELEIELKKCRATSVNVTKWKDVLREASQNKEIKKTALEQAEGNLKESTDERAKEGKHIISLIIALLAVIGGMAFVVIGMIFRTGLFNATYQETSLNGLIIMAFGLIVLWFRRRWQKNGEKRYHEFQSEAERCRKEYESILGEEEAIKMKIDELSKDASRVGSLADELESLKARVEAGYRQYETVKKTAEYLERAKNNLNAHYIERLHRLFREYAAKLDDTGNVVRALDEPENYGHYMENPGSGFSDVIGISARLALIEALFEGESPFIVLDDPLINLDDDKFANTIHVIEELAQRFQIIYLTCNGERIKRVRKQGGK